MARSNADFKRDVIQATRDGRLVWSPAISFVGGAEEFSTNAGGTYFSVKFPHGAGPAAMHVATGTSPRESQTVVFRGVDRAVFEGELRAAILAATIARLDDVTALLNALPRADRRRPTVRSRFLVPAQARLEGALTAATNRKNGVRWQVDSGEGKRWYVTAGPSDVPRFRVQLDGRVDVLREQTNMGWHTFGAGRPQSLLIRSIEKQIRVRVMQGAAAALKNAGQSVA